eukprot:m51a1_g14042 hypothetical protein (137) ;mRNA; f:1176682-1177184
MGCGVSTGRPSAHVKVPSEQPVGVVAELRDAENGQESPRPLPQSGAKRGTRHIADLGEFYDSLGEHNRSIELYERKAADARAAGDRAAECRALESLAAAHAALGDPQNVVAICEKALAIARHATRTPPSLGWPAGR